MDRARKQDGFDKYFNAKILALLLWNFGNIGSESHRTFEQRINRFFSTNLRITTTANKIGKITKIDNEIIELLLKASLEVSFDIL